MVGDTRARNMARWCWISELLWHGLELARNPPKKKYQKCSKTHVHWWYLVFKLKIQKTAWDHVFVSLLDPLKCWRLEWWYFTQRKEPWCASGKLSIHQGCFRKILVLQTWRSFNTNRKQIMNLNIFHFCQPWQDPMIDSTYSRVLMPVLIANLGHVDNMLHNHRSCRVLVNMLLHLLASIQQHVQHQKNGSNKTKYDQLALRMSSTQTLHHVWTIPFHKQSRCETSALFQNPTWILHPSRTASNHWGISTPHSNHQNSAMAECPVTPKVLKSVPPVTTNHLFRNYRDENW